MAAPIKLKIGISCHGLITALPIGILTPSASGSDIYDVIWHWLRHNSKCLFICDIAVDKCINPPPGDRSMLLCVQDVNKRTILCVEIRHEKINSDVSGEINGFKILVDSFITPLYEMDDIELLNNAEDVLGLMNAIATTDSPINTANNKLSSVSYRWTIACKTAAEVRAALLEMVNFNISLMTADSVRMVTTPFYDDLLTGLLESIFSTRRAEVKLNKVSRQIEVSAKVASSLRINYGAVAAVCATTLFTGVVGHMEAEPPSTLPERASKRPRTSVTRIETTLLGSIGLADLATSIDLIRRFRQTYSPVENSELYAAPIIFKMRPNANLKTALLKKNAASEKNYCDTIIKKQLMNYFTHMRREALLMEPQSYLTGSNISAHQSAHLRQILRRLLMCRESMVSNERVLENAATANFSSAYRESSDISTMVNVIAIEIFDLIFKAIPDTLASHGIVALIECQRLLCVYV